MIERKQNRSPMTCVSLKSATFSNMAALLSELIKMSHSKPQTFTPPSSPTEISFFYICLLDDRRFSVSVLKIDIAWLSELKRDWADIWEWLLVFEMNQKAIRLNNSVGKWYFNMFRVFGISPNHTRKAKEAVEHISSVGNIIWHWDNKWCSTTVTECFDERT